MEEYTILLLDDNGGILKGLARQLSPHKVIACKNPVEALYHADALNYDFDLLISDTRLGKNVPMTGIMVARNLRALGYEAPIIGMSGEDVPSIKREWEGLADHFYLKNSGEDIKEIAEELIRKYRSMPD